MRAAFPAVLFLAAVSEAHALQVSILRGRIGPGEGQEAGVAGLRPGERFRAAWIDPTGRVRGWWGLRAGRGGEGRVRFRAAGAAPGAHRVAAWREGSRPGEAPEAGFEIMPGDAPAYLAAVDASALGLERAEELAREVGASAVASAGTEAPRAPLGWVVRALDGGPTFLRLDEADLRSRRAAYDESRAEALLSRPACLRDGRLLADVWRWAGPRARSAALARPWLWSLGRDVGLGAEDAALDFCRSERCTWAFASDLRRRHGEVASLNRRWGAAFRTWSEVRPPTAREAVEAIGTPGARTASVLAAWSDHRDFMDRTWAGALGDWAGLLRSAAPGARVGIEGVSLPGVFTGADPTRLFDALDWVEVAPEPLAMALARSFAPARCRLVTQLGAGEAPGTLFRGLANGHRGALILAGDGPGLDEGELPEVLGTIGGGLGELFSLSTWEPDPVAVLYSPPSVRAEWVVRAARGEEPRTGAALAAWAALLSDIGIAARFVGAEDVARGALRGGRIRALVLPRAYVLGRAGLAEIARFARGGGLVVADAGAGAFGEGLADGTPGEVGAVFGISRRGTEEVSDTSSVAGETVLAGMDLPGAYIDGVDASVVELAEPDVRGVSARALATRGGAAGLFTNSFGLGRGVYLNLGLERYPAERLSPRGAATRRLLRNVLELARVAPRVGVIAGGAEVDGCERVVRRVEEMELVTLHRDGAFGAERVQAELVFPGPALCFDVLTGVLIGRGERVGVRLRAGTRVFARLPYDVERISLRAAERGGVVRYRGMIETPNDVAGTHVVRRELRYADDRPVPGGGATIVADRGVFKGSVALAANEPPGEYRLVFRDVASGVEAEVSIARRSAPLAEAFPLADAAPAEAEDTP